MAKEGTARTNPNAPHNQPFQLNGRKSSKLRSWWNAGSPTYWRNARKEKKDQE